MVKRHIIANSLAWLLGAGLAAAQAVTSGSIAGRVTDEAGIPLAGAAVSVSSQQGATTVVTNDRGHFVAPHLSPGLYSVRVGLQGFRSVERGQIDVRVGQRVDLAFTLLLGEFSEAVEVQGSSPVVDFSSATAATVLEGSLLRDVPVGRQIGDALYLAPGVSSSGGAGAPNPSISGASGLENQYVVDGVNVNHPRYGTLGIFARGYGSLGTGLTVDFVDEIQVRTAGADAEFGQSTGGVVSVITKSGSNVLKGSLFMYVRPRGLEGGRREVSLVNGAVNTVGAQTLEAGVAAGGPILRDRIFLFAAIDPQRDRAQLVAPEGFPLRERGEVARARGVTPYAAKLSFTPWNEHRFELSAFGDPAAGDMGPQAPDALLNRDTSGFSSLRYGTHSQTIRYQGVPAASWLVEASVGHTKTSFSEQPLVDQWLVTDYTVSPVAISGGKGRFEPVSSGDSRQYHLKSAHILGRHELRYGASVEDVDFSFTDGRTGTSITLADGGTTTSGVLVSVLKDPTLGRIYRASDGRQSPARSSSQRSLGIFVQDKAEVGKRVSVTAGVRYEEQRLGGPAGRFTLAGNWAPRLGVIVDPSGTGRSKWYASAGVYFATLPNSLAVLAFGGRGWRLLRGDYYDAALTRPIPDGVSAGGTTTHLLLVGTQASTFDPAARAGYIREGLTGFELELAPMLNVGVRYVYRDMPRILEDVGTASIVLVYGKDPAAQGVNYFITNPRDGYPATVNGVGAFETLTHRYQAVELTADKRFSGRWTMLGSYRWSRLQGSYEGYYRNDTSQGAPSQSSLDDFPINDPSYVAIGVPRYHFRGDIRYQGKLGEGPLPTDRPHQLKLFASYALAAGVNLGVGAYASSGRPLTPMASNPALNRAGEIPEAPRGTGIGTVDGFERRTPFEWSLDLHTDFPVHLGVFRLVALADIFNVLGAQRVVDYDQNTEKTFGVANPDFGQRTRYQSPRQVRLGVRLEL